MKKEICSIPLEKIKSPVELQVSDAFQKRIKKTHSLLLDYDLLLAVEKDSFKDTYLLVGGYARYDYLVSIGQKYALCIIEEVSENLSEQHTKILRRLFNNGESSKENKQKILDILSKFNITIDYITKRTGLTKSELQNNYKYHNNIPKKYINEHTSEKTMNWIENLSVDQSVKSFLFERAGLPQGNSKRLTHDSVKIIKKFLNQEPRFNHLTPIQQVKVLGCAINFRGMVVDLLKSIVNEYTKPKKII